MAAKKKRTTKQIGIVVNLEEARMLRKLAESYGLSMSEMVRQLIRNESYRSN